jgi:hypothetical protein
MNGETDEKIITKLDKKEDREILDHIPILRLSKGTIFRDGSLGPANGF